MSKLATCLVMAVGALAFAGCADAIVGDWQSVDGWCTNTQHDEISIASDLTGSGVIALGCDAKTGDAKRCSAVFQATERVDKSGLWELQGDFGYCDAFKQEIGRLYKDCTLENSDAELRCCDPNGANCFNYLRQ